MLKGRTAVITGSTSGIGAGIARALAAQGADIVLNGFGEAAAIETFRAALAAEFGVRVLYHGADLARADHCAALVREAETALGRLDILVNNAGIQHVARVEDFPPERWDAVLAVNLSSAFHTIRAALPGWRLAPVVLARQARVALGDEVGQILQAPLVAVLVGERPGLSVADSLGIYLTYAPAVGCRDAARNCISNIHGAGLSPQDAAAKLAWLATHARRLRLTGVALKEDAAPAALPVTPSIPASYDSKEGAGR